MEQKIAINVGSLDDVATVVQCGIELAHILKKDLLLFQEANKKSLDEAQKEMDLFTNNLIQSKTFKYDIENFVCKGKIEEDFDFLAEEKEVLAYVYSKDQGRRMLSKLKDSPTPFLFVDDKTEMSSIFSNIIVPVGYMAKAKDSALWASYIARYSKTNVTLLAATESEKEDQHDVNSHIRSIENLYEKFGFGFEVVPTTKATWCIQEYSVGYAKEQKAGLLILAGTQPLTLLEKILPLPEKSMLKKSGELPIMFVNSQREMYVLCG